MFTTFIITLITSSLVTIFFLASLHLATWTRAGWSPSAILKAYGVRAVCAPVSLVIRANAWRRATYLD